MAATELATLFQKRTSKTVRHGPPFMNLHQPHSSLAALGAMRVM